MRASPARLRPRHAQMTRCVWKAENVTQDRFACLEDTCNVWVQIAHGLAHVSWDTEKHILGHAVCRDDWHVLSRPCPKPHISYLNTVCIKSCIGVLTYVSWDTENHILGHAVCRDDWHVLSDHVLSHKSVYLNTCASSRASVS